MPEYSEYIIYADESGDHSLGKINPWYPIFVLSFCVFKKEHYAHRVTPLLRMLKFSTFGHDMVVLHEYEIRKKRGAFSALGKEAREMFLQQLDQIVSQSDFELLGVVIDKQKLKDDEKSNQHPYHLAMQLGLEKLYQFLQDRGQGSCLTHVVFESRGRTEDLALELEFKRVCQGHNVFGTVLPFQIVLSDKKTNSEGLQFADMVARPIGLSVLQPGQPNRALRTLERKFFQNAVGEKMGHGLCLHP